MLQDYIQNESHYYDVVFNSLSTQSESLQTLNFTKLNFNTLTLSDEAVNSLCSLQNIRELKLDRCGCSSFILNSWAKKLTNLEVFEFTNSKTVSEDFLIQIIQSSSQTLTKLVLVFVYKRDHVRGSNY